MSSPRIINRQIVHALRPLLDVDVTDAAAEAHAATETAEVDALIDQAEREWAAAERTETARISRMFTDQPRARRAHRRADRTVLRMLPDLLRPLGAPDELAVRELPVRCPNVRTDVGCSTCGREHAESA